MPHKDGPLYEPLVAILSLDGPAMLCFWDSLQVLLIHSLHRK